MATRTANPPGGLSDQIDELDHLLDQLLKLPIDKVRSPSSKLPASQVHLAIINEDDDEDEGTDSIPQADILSLNPHDHSTQMTIKIEHDQELSGSMEKENGLTLTDTTNTYSALAHEEAPSSPPVEVKDNLPANEIPWIEDEPIGNRGPQVEIVMGPTCDVVMANSPVEVDTPREKRIRRSWTFWILWTWTWCFDQTFGHFFPWLRRPGVKFLLGLIGVVLFAVSIYLFWIGWRR